MQRAWQWVTRRDVYHVGFWLLATLVLLWLEAPIDSGVKLSSSLVSIGFYAAIVYFNLDYLIPNYFAEKTVWRYFALFVAACLIATPLRALTLHLITASDPVMNMAAAQRLDLILLSHLVAGSASTMLKVAGDWRRNSQERRLHESQRLQSELKFLRSQVNPHFLFNTLNSLYALTLRKSDRAPETVLKLSNMMRYMLYDSNSRTVPLSQEVDYIRNYIDLERLRHGDKANVVFDIEGVITDQVIAPMVFVTFVENAFKHGMSRLIQGAYVHIMLLIDRDELRFHIENAMPPPSADATKQPGGIGLINVQRRLELLYPDRHELQTLAAKKHYAVDLYLNLSEERERAPLTLRNTTAA